MISLDTELMKTLVEGCVTANNNIEDAVAALAGITSHRDWGCKEKSRIDEYTDTNKNKIKQLQECSGNFLSILRQVTHDFEAAESSIADMASNVDVSIGTAIGVTPTGTNIPAPQLNDIIDGSIMPLENILSDIKSGIGSVTATKIGSYVAKTITESIAPVEFSSIVL